MSCPYGGCCDPDEDKPVTAVRTELFRCRHCGVAKYFQCQIMLDGSSSWVPLVSTCTSGMPQCEPSNTQMSTIDLSQGRLRLGLPVKRKRR